MAIGIPINGPRSTPLENSLSIPSAHDKVLVLFKYIYAFSFGFKISIRLKYIEVNSTQVRKPFLNFIPISSNHKLLLFLSSGKVLTLDPNVLPGGKASPKSYIELINVGVDEKLIGVFNANKQKKLLLISKFGKGFISISENMLTNQKKGKNIINLKNNDALLNVHSLENKYLALVSKNEKLLVFDTSTLPTLNKGAGVQLMKIKDKDHIVDSSLIDLNVGLSWRKAAKTKILKDVQFWKGKRAQVGKKIPKGFNKNLKFIS